MNGLYWVGIRESDIIPICDLFQGSVTVFGSHSGGNESFSAATGFRVNHNIPNDAITSFFMEKTSNILKADSQARFIFYNPRSAYHMRAEVTQKTLGLNSYNLLVMLRDKILIRQWFSDLIPVLSTIAISAGSICYDAIMSLFPNNKGIILQENIAAGGYGTYLLNSREDFDSILDSIDTKCSMLISAYRENSIPLNTHVQITSDGVTLFPPSVQILRKNGKNVLYKGADFAACGKLPTDVIIKIREYSLKIALKLKEFNYRGILGIDYLAADNEVYFIEINARYQASTFLLNIGLIDNHLESVQAKQVKFEEEEEKEESRNVLDLSAVTIPYSMYMFTQTPAAPQASELLERYEGKKRPKHVHAVYWDGLEREDKILIEDNTSLCRVTFHGTILSDEYELLPGVISDR